MLKLINLLGHGHCRLVSEEDECEQEVFFENNNWERLLNFRFKTIPFR